MSKVPENNRRGTLFGHPTGLFTLFFAEMWERFSFYGMKALLLFYMLKDFLRYNDGQGYTVLGAYASLVYMTPFFGGLIADRILGARRAVVLGGLLMAAGHLLMTVRHELGFFFALGLLIAGNGFFKPNISTMVGTLYPADSPKRDGGFTIFYMGINFGAAAAPILCGYVGETYGWHYGFGLATIGMVIGVAIFVVPNRLAQLLIMAAAITLGAGMLWFRPGEPFTTGISVLVGVLILAAGVTAWVALNRGGLPKTAGAPKDPELLRRKVLGPITAEWAVYLGALLAVPILMLLVSGFSPFTDKGEAVHLLSDDFVKELAESESKLARVSGVVLKEISRPAALILLLSAVGAVAYLGYAAVKLDTIPRQRMYVVLVLTLFSVLFWTFFEQASSSINNFTDRNVDRVLGGRSVRQDEVGSVITFRLEPETSDPELSKLPLLSQEQLGRRYGNVSAARQIERAIRKEEEALKSLEPKEIDALATGATANQVLTLTGLTYLRSVAKADGARPEERKLDWLVVQENVGMRIDGAEVPASWFQAVNPVYIILFGMVFSGLWYFLAQRGLEPSTTVKFALGLLQLAGGFGAFWYGAQSADERGMVSIVWLFLGYLLITTGELCISPVGLSMVTRMAPRYLVSTVMGMWFLTTALSEYFAAIIAQFTGVGTGGDGGAKPIPVPKETVHLYGDVFGWIAAVAAGSAVVCLLLSPLLTYWMHEQELAEEAKAERTPTTGEE